jgi:hypothetical protein
VSTGARARLASMTTMSRTFAHRKQHRAAEGLRQLRHVRARVGAHVQPREKGLRERQHAGAERIFLRFRVLPQQSQRHQRGGEPRHGRLRHLGERREFAVAQAPSAAAEAIEHRDAALERRDGALLLAVLAHALAATFLRARTQVRALSGKRGLQLHPG